MIYIVFSFTVSHGWSCSLGLNPFKVSFIDQNVLLFRLRLTTTGITKNWQRLRIFSEIETGNASPAQWLRMPDCLSKDEPMSLWRLLKRVQQGKVRKYSPLSENFHFCHFKAPALLFGLMIYTFR